MKKSYLALLTIPFMFTACSTSVLNQNIEQENIEKKAEVISNQVVEKPNDILSIKDGKQNLQINVIGTSCKTVKGVNIEIQRKINKMSSSLNDKLELVTKIDESPYQKGFEYSFEYCKQEDKSLILTIDYTKYAEPINYKSDSIVPDIQEFKSKVKILPNSPLQFGSLSIEYITK